LPQSFAQTATLETLPAAVEQSDYAHLLKHSAFRKGQGKTYTFIITVLATCGFLAFQLFFNTPSDDHWIGWLPVGYGVWYVLNIILISPWLTLREIKNQPYVALPQQYRIDKAGIRSHVVLPGLDVEWEKTHILRWDEIEDISEQAGTLIIYLSASKRFLIPRNAFTDDQHRQIFTNAAHKWLSETYEVSPRDELFRSEKQAQF